jgi:hypothetical protein
MTFSPFIDYPIERRGSTSQLKVKEVNYGVGKMAAIPRHNTVAAVPRAGGDGTAL